MALNLAAAAARAGEDVLLVEADLRRPRLAERLGLHVAAGLSSVLGGGEPVGSGSCTGVSLAGSSGREPGVAGGSGPIAGSRPLGGGELGV